jgi:hypothetical protein
MEEMHVCYGGALRSLGTVDFGKYVNTHPCKTIEDEREETLLTLYISLGQRVPIEHM